MNEDQFRSSSRLAASGGHQRASLRDSPVRAQTSPGETFADRGPSTRVPEPMAAIFLCLGSLVHGSSMSWRGGNRLLPHLTHGLPAGHYDTQAMRMHAPSGGVQIPQLAFADLPPWTDGRPARISGAQRRRARDTVGNTQAATGRATRGASLAEGYRTRIGGDRYAHARAVGSSRGRIAGIAWVIDAGESWWAGHANEAPTLLRRVCLMVPPPLAPPQSPRLASGLGINRIHEHGEPEAPKDGEQATPARGRREEWGPASNTTAVHGPLPSPSANRRRPVKRAVGSRARRTRGTASMPGLLMLPCNSFSPSRDDANKLPNDCHARRSSSQ